MKLSRLIGAHLSLFSLSRFLSQTHLQRHTHLLACSLSHTHITTLVSTQVRTQAHLQTSNTHSFSHACKHTGTSTHSTHPHTLSNTPTHTQISFALSEVSSFYVSYFRPISYEPYPSLSLSNGFLFFITSLPLTLSPFSIGFLSVPQASVSLTTFQFFRFEPTPISSHGPKKQLLLLSFVKDSLHRFDRLMFHFSMALQYITIYHGSSFASYA